MSDTPKKFIEALDFITRSKGPTASSMGTLEALHVNRTRSVFEDRNIVGVGVSEKVVAAKSTGELSVCFYVEKKLPQSKLKAGKLIPSVLSTPDGSACFTDVKVVGRIAPQVNKKIKPIQSGFSIGHKDGDTGTLGAIVKKDGAFFALSNSHVLAKSGTATLGDAILYPGSVDGGLGIHQIAKLSKFVKFKGTGEFINLFDAAIARIGAQHTAKLDFSILHVSGTPTTIEPQRLMKVVKRGRTTGDTEGEIIDVNFRVVFPYEALGTDIGFTDQVLCSRYTRSGDSGSIVVDKASGKIVGLHFAGSDKSSIFSPIRPIIDAFDFSFVKA